MNRSLVVGMWLAAGLPLAGCSTFEPRTVRIDAVAGMYRGVTLNYKIDGGQLSEPMTVARIARHQVSQERLPSSPYPDRSVAQLSIRYPHPDGKAGYALVEMVVETQTPPNAQDEAKKAAWQQWADAFAATAQDILPGVKMSGGVYEAWALDIVKSDLDRVVAALSQNGYFVNPSKPTMGVELAVRIDNFQAVKRWTREPELDILMDRIRQEGQLVSYERPVEHGSKATVAGSAGSTQAKFASQEQAGPALVPAGPQNNAYRNPVETTQPSPSPAYAAPYTPPPPSTPPTVLPSYQRPAGGAVQPPAVNPPRAAVPPPGNPRNRWQKPPQYRRPPAPVPGATAPNAPTQQPAGAARSRFAPLIRAPRMPWQRRGPEANAQQPGSPPASQAGKGYDPRRSRYGTQPPAGRRAPFQRSPARAPAPTGPYSANPQSDPSSSGSPANWPRPPQISTRPSAY